MGSWRAVGDQDQSREVASICTNGTGTRMVLKEPVAIVSKLIGPLQSRRSVCWISILLIGGKGTVSQGHAGDTFLVGDDPEMSTSPGAARALFCRDAANAPSLYPRACRRGAFTRFSWNLVALMSALALS